MKFKNAAAFLCISIFLTELRAQKKILPVPLSLLSPVRKEVREKQLWWTSFRYAKISVYRVRDDLANATLAEFVLEMIYPSLVEIRPLYKPDQ